MKTTHKTLLTAICLSCLSLPADARPVSYPGGVTAMLMNDGDSNSLHLHYSPTAQYSVGYKAEYWREKDYGIQALQLNALLKRWNKPDSQANIYLKSGAGVAYSDKDAFDREVQPAFYTGLAGDWENRRFFTSYENRFTEAGDIDQTFMEKARVGVAPYIGEYGDLHTWLMLEVRHAPEAKDKVTVTPMVRFFKDTHLVEAGFSNQGTLLFNWVIRY